MDLKEIRNEIDKIDEQIVKLLLERNELTTKVAAYKKENNLPVLNAGREQEILDSISAGRDPETAEYLKEIYKTIFEKSREHQSRLL